MDVVSKKTLKLFSGQGHPELGSEIAAALGIPLGDVKLSTFASGESYVRYGENIVVPAFLLQTHCGRSTIGSEQLLMIGAANARREADPAVVP
jgi:ribose-phosphate pyrophosphokinase